LLVHAATGQSDDETWASPPAATLQSRLSTAGRWGLGFQADSQTLCADPVEEIRQNWGLHSIVPTQERLRGVA